MSREVRKTEELLGKKNSMIEVCMENCNKKLLYKNKKDLVLSPGLVDIHSHFPGTKVTSQRLLASILLDEQLTPVSDL